MRALRLRTADLFPPVPEFSLTCRYSGVSHLQTLVSLRGTAWRSPCCHVAGQTGNVTCKEFASNAATTAYATKLEPVKKSDKLHAHFATTPLCALHAPAGCSTGTVCHLLQSSGLLLQYAPCHCPSRRALHCSLRVCSKSDLLPWTLRPARIQPRGLQG